LALDDTKPAALGPEQDRNGRNASMNSLRGAFILHFFT